MSDTPRRAFGASSRPRRRDVMVDLPTARSMLPLVKSIVRDIVARRSQLNHLRPERDCLDRNRRQLNWTERARRYQLHEEIQAAEGDYTAAMNELRELGLTLVDIDSGRVAFPTRINGRPAVFTWQPGEESVMYWNYEDEDLRRPIPSEWIPGTPMRLKK